MDAHDVDAMLKGMLKQLEKDEADGRLEGLTVTDLADAVSHPKAPQMIAEIMDIEGSSAAVGEPAPDFTLPRLQGSEAPTASVTLSEHFGTRPVALIFGSYT
jgi:hypothetical protein